MINVLKFIGIGYLLLCGLLWLFQEKLIFFPQKLGKDFQYRFADEFEEINIPAKDGSLINTLLFKTEASKGLIFYLHGNAGSLADWGDVATTYTQWGYDVLIMDYRGYGKSEGKITSKKQFFEDVQTVYDEALKRYSEDKISVLGYSLGSGPAAKLASDNSPRLLILQTPYYKLTDIGKQRFPFIPVFLLKYTFNTTDYLKECKMPVVLFHGDKDELIPHEASLRLQKEFKPGDRLFILEGQTHNGVTNNPDYQRELEIVLRESYGE